MSLFEVDQSKCKRDAICVAECPLGLIEMKSEDAFPTPIQGADELCVNCGHCVAVCPAAALSLNTMAPEDCMAVRKELLPSADQLCHLVLSRRSIRCYRKTAVDRETIGRLLDCVRYAPSGHNRQPVRWLVIEGREKLDPLAGMVIEWMRVMIRDHPEIAQPMHMDRVVHAWERGQDRILRGAPQLIVAHGLAPAPVSQMACAIALSYLDIVAAPMGLGTCWAGYFQAAATFYPPLTQALALPEGHQSFGAMMIGYPGHVYHRVPKRNDPVVTWL